MEIVNSSHCDYTLQLSASPHTVSVLTMAAAIYSIDQ